ncbi:thyrotropin-releasing hormone-degrading ectoenzyme-like [Pseudomyrmex gracilis]|uniref:thyrotropin-releasing hormone-degrading ectoenzyme-like n=1 Tax=Pseudomyrmex gracilis TaxID=219809 RepID=UPI000995014D|nr:thyrotropin-releasing hormone-degrading ectoenzyme-like [Pseudomyrmex gracilis]
MAFPRLLTSVLILAAAIALSETWENNTYEYRLPENVAPVHYDIKLIPYIEEGNFTFDGESSIVVEIRRTTRELKLHIVWLTIDETATTLISNNDSYTPTNHTYCSMTQMLTLTFDNELSPGVYTLRMKFAGVLKNTPYGFYVTSYINEEGRKIWLASTNFEMRWARHAFPCWDEPALKATFNISIKHNRNYTALSNMPIREQTEDGSEDGMIWTHFEKTPIMSTYLVAFVVSDYVRISNEDGTVNTWCRSAVTPYVKYPQEVATRAKQLLTEYTNITYKVPKMDLAAVPELEFTAMENWGLIIYRELSLSYNEESDTLYHKHHVGEVVAHEMAHQWFGNLVGPLWWTDLWLSEGFATFFAYYILDQMYKDCRIMERSVVFIQHNTLEFDNVENKILVPVMYELENFEETDSLFGSIMYKKAFCVLRMIQNIITEDVFRKGVIKYLHAHQFGSITADDLWSAFQEVLNESDVPHDDYKVKEVMDTWIKKRHYPVVCVTMNYDTDEVLLTQRHLRSGSEINKYDDKWWIPITFATRSNPDFSATAPTVWLRPQDRHVILNGIEPNDWIVVNLQSMGYYRVNYDLYNWLKIVNCLNSDDYVKIHVLNRAQLIDDAHFFMWTHQLDVDTFLSLITYYERETDFIAWQPMFALFESNAQVFKFPQTSCLQRFFAKLMNNLIESMGYEEDPADDDFTKMNRMSVLRWACAFGHVKCKTMATTLLSQHLADPETHKVSPNLKDWIFCNGLAGANASTWNKFKETYVKNSDMILLRYLTCSDDPDILINFLDTSLSNNSLTNNDYKIIYSSIIRRHVNNDLVLDYLLANLNKTISRGFSLTGIIAGIIHNTHSAERFEKITNFVKSNFDKIFEKIKPMYYHETDLTWSNLVYTFRPACALIE